MALSVSSWPCQFHFVLVSLTLTLWVLPWSCWSHLDFVSLHWLCQSHLDLVSLTLVLSVLPQPCQSHRCLVSLPSTLSVSNHFVAISLWPCQSHRCLVSLTLASSLYLVSLQWPCCNLTLTLSVSPLPCQSPMDLFQSHCDLVSLTIALLIFLLPCQSPMDLFQSQCDLVSLTLALSRYHVSLQSLCCNLTMTLSASPWWWLFWTWMTWLPSAFGPWASSTAPSGSCLPLPPRWGSPCPPARCAASCEPPPWCDLWRETYDPNSHQVEVQRMYLDVGSFIIIKMTPIQKYNSVTQNEQLCQMLLFNTK